MDTRRDFLKQTFLGLAALGVPGTALASSLPTSYLLSPLGQGADLGLGWSLGKVFPPHEGAITVNLRHDSGREARVDICLRAGAPKGPASTDYLDFIVMDGGNGSAPMDESLGRVVRRLAAVAEENERHELHRIEQLASHAERVEQHPDSMALAARRLSPGAPTA